MKKLETTSATRASTSRRGGRPRKGSLYWTKSGWRARLTVDVDGVPVQKTFKLETSDRQAARVKLRRLVKHHAGGGAAEADQEASRAETFTEASERIVGESSIRTKKARLDRLKMHAFPAFGPKLVTDITAGDLRDVLKGMAGDGASKETCIKI